jgi:hypothetical protein
MTKANPYSLIVSDGAVRSTLGTGQFCSDQHAIVLA